MAVQKYKKKELLKMVRKLQQKNDSVIGGSQKTADDGLLETLTQCQETALSMGSYLETTGNTAAHLVGILEDYCENIYRMCLFISDEKQCLELSEKIREQLDQLSRMIQQDLPDDRPEAVFLPYKASMWDSMESVWQAARQDERCDAYVIPVPYFDKNPDGSLGQMHYEGKEYPDYVPVVSWKEYSLEEHRPDMIFIHNPYDECNMVTNIHPAFYSQNLKRYTDILVYIPYFITMNDRISTDFCTLPGVLNADRVIVESENVRKTYIEELCRLEKENHCKHASGSMEEKVVALGSPKLDKMAGVAKESVDIPEAWNKIIRKPDGTAKKVILYNTGITALLNNDERMLAKINDVLRIFYEKRNEVALLWRPHPLMAATLQAMRPFLWEKYRAIAERYRRENWGIYDDTRELDRALCVCDGMISDPSSLVPLIQAAGKPVLIQDTTGELPPHDKYASIRHGKLACRQPAFDGENYWFANRWYNALIRINRTSGETECIGPFPGEEIFHTDLYLKSLYHKGKIYFPPFYARNIAVYDIQKREFCTIPLKPLEELQFCKMKRIDRNAPKLFNDIIPSGGYIYFSPAAGYPALIRINCENGETEYLTDFLKVIDERYFCYSEYYSFKSCFLTEDRLLITSSRSYAVIEYDLNTKKSEITYIEDVNLKSILKNGGQIGEYIRHGDDFWISMVLPKPPFYYRSILQWRHADNRAMRYTDLKNVVEHEEGNQFLMTGGKFAGGYIWYVSDYPGKTIKIDVSSGEVSASADFDWLSELAEEAGRNLVYDSVEFPRYGLICFSTLYHLNALIEWNVTENEFRIFDLTLDEKSADFYAGLKREEQLKALAQKSGHSFLVENRHCDLTEFIKIAAAVPETRLAETGCQEEKIGGRIYAYLKELVLSGSSG